MERAELRDRIKNGQVFVYPTDTIYGLGCDATNEKAVQRIRELKRRDSKPFSIIAPSKAWILQNCDVPDPTWLDKFPGPYTFIFDMIDDCVAPSVAQGSLGVRIPAHWIAEVAAELMIPLVTTSVNLSGQKPCSDPKNLPFAVDFVIDEGKTDGKPSAVWDLRGEPKQAR